MASSCKLNKKYWFVGFLGMVAIAISSCDSASRDSTLSFAYAPGAKMLGTPDGHIEIMKSGIDYTFGSKLKVCVERTRLSTISDESLLFETKLAHAMWLNAAGYGSDTFDLFAFELADKCHVKDVENMGNVILADFDKAEAGDEYAKVFTEPSMSCRSNVDGEYACEGDGPMVIGWGVSGQGSPVTSSKTSDQWMSVSESAPAVAILSPYIDWLPLTVGIANNAQISPAIRGSLDDRYQQLLESPSPTFKQLTSFAEALTDHKIILASDMVFSEIMEDAAQNLDEFEGKIYRPQLAAFHTLLHEYDSGNLWIEREYSKGLPHGEWRQWFESGKVKSLGQFTNGESDGEFWSWYDNGQLAEYNVIKAGQDITQKTFIKDGAIYNNYVYHNGNRVGVVGGEFCKVNKQPDRSQR